MKPVNSAKHTTAGFSLVEVTIAMAIAAVAVLSLIGMIPSGMDTMVKAGDTAIMARIHQSILGEMQLTPFTELNSLFDGEERHYDSQGEEIDEIRGGEIEHIYSARITVPNRGGGLPAIFSGDGGMNASWPGADLGDGDNARLQLVIVEVAPAGGRYSVQGAAFWNDPHNFREISTYQTLVADTGEDFGR